VKAGQFREDLFYRLHVLPLTIPPLRARREDIPHLLRHFVARFCAEENRPITGISGEAMTMLGQMPWPGNVRQLENAVYRAVVMSEGGQLQASDFPQTAVGQASQTHDEPMTMEASSQNSSDHVSGIEIPIAPTASANRFQPAYGTLGMVGEDGEVRPLEEMEAEAIRFAISHYRGQMSEVARRLKIGRSTLYRKLEEADATTPESDSANADR
jgi:DNA-binding NtrC family response regulator